MRLTDRRVLVTGGAGFIGACLANRLAAENEVIALDDRSLGTPANLTDEVQFVEGCILDAELPVDVDVVFHLAALSSLPMHIDDPARGARVNVEGFVNVVEQARRAGCETVVYASTSSVYGDRIDPTPEDVPVTATTAYEASKLARERYAEHFVEQYGLSVAGLRYFSVYQGLAGTERHKGQYANLIAQFADDVANGRSPVIWGDGTQSRDFIHVDDVVDATIQAAAHPLSGVYNVGTGTRHTLLDVLDRLTELLDAEIEPTYVENPLPEDVYVHHTRADSSALQDTTGWEPTIDFEEGLQRVCRQYR